MELQYNLLWFEDSDRFIKLYTKRIGKFLDDLAGYSLDLIHKTNCDNLDECLNKDLDLILVDWNLNPGKSGKKSGEQLIQEIRQKGVFTEVIFYSALDNFEEQPFKLNGVYFTDTDGDNLLSRIEEIIKHTLQRNLRISVTRGLFIASTIDLVEKLEDIISKVLKLGDSPQKFFQDYIVQAEFFTDVSKYTIVKDFLNREIALLKKKIADSGEGTQTNELEERLKAIEKMKKLFNKFKDDIIELRNHLAHAKPIPGERNSLNVRNRQKREFEKWEFTLAKCKEFRKKFIIHAENIEKIYELINNFS